MNINVLRWKGRLGKLKGLSALILFFAFISTLIGLINLSAALRNPAEPETVTISDLLDSPIGTGRYISVTGLAAYDVGYEQTEDGKTTATYYFLIDVDTGDMVLVKHPSAIVAATKSGTATIKGMTRGAPSDLKRAIEDDEPLMTKNDLRTTTTLYVADDTAPPSTVNSIVCLVVSVLVGVVCCIPFLFSSITFVPFPLDVTTIQPKGQPTVGATGTFVHLKAIEPPEIGERARKFANATANVIPRGERDLMIYIHHILTTKTYGVTVNKTETDWGIFLDAHNVSTITAGKILGWKDKWAVQFEYNGPKGKPEKLYLTFDNAGDQMEIVALLRQMQFDVQFNVLTGETI